MGINPRWDATQRIPNDAPGRGKQTERELYRQVAELGATSARTTSDARPALARLIA
ncbi:MAG TPA: hypothetical protein VFT22_25680 [Kofleriaceae bacterium]|nr:hypothetical protein [Kofleriaceae bacterium]